MSFTSFDPATVGSAGVVLTNGNLTVTCTTPPSITGAKGKVADALSSGKYYFEFVWDAPGGAGSDAGVGIGTPASSYTNLGNSATVGAIVYSSSSVYCNGTNEGGLGGVIGTGSTIGVAVDFDAGRIWLRKGTGLWNNSATADPATGVGGFAIPTATSYVPVVTSSAAGSSNKATLNAGDTPFNSTPPSGYNGGWPASNLLPKSRARWIG